MKEVPPTQVPEVAAYLDDKAMLDTYCESKQDVVATLRLLIERVNSARQVADKAVRAAGVFCGPWRKHTSKTEVDTDLLIERIGVDKFKEIGGEVIVKPSYKIDAKKLELALAKNAIPPELGEEVIKKTVSYQAPKDLNF